MPCINYASPAASFVEGHNPTDLADKITERLRKAPHLEVQIVVTNIRYTAFFIERGSSNYRPETD